MRRISLLLCLALAGQFPDLQAQTGLRVGFTAGPNISRANPTDSFPSQFSRRNRAGATLGFSFEYGLSANSAILGGIHYVNKGYKISNDTFTLNPFIVRRINSINVPIGFTFKQRFNDQNFIRENFGLSYTFRFDSQDSVVATNGNPGTYSITEKPAASGYPMFFLGLELGGTTESKNTYAFGLNFFQTFGRDADIRGVGGVNRNRFFDMVYKGGFANITFTYTFSLQNLKKSEEWFY